VHHNCSTVQTGLQGILHGGQGVEGGGGKKKGTAPIRMFLQTKEKKNTKDIKTFFLEGSQLFTEFCFLREGLGT